MIGIRATIPSRGYLLEREAKAFRCNDEKKGLMSCERWHHTCRRCGIHLVPRGFIDPSSWLDEGGLCRSCHKEYEEWKQKRDKELMAQWNKESEAVKQFHIKNGTAPFFGFKNEYIRWMKENRIVTVEFKEIEP